MKRELVALLLVLPLLALGTGLWLCGQLIGVGEDAQGFAAVLRWVWEGRYPPSEKRS